jgi:1-deoxy-D-xylulose-5-phosphate reductoisomerase
VSSRRDIVILGSTGSIGTQALDLVRANPDRFRVVGPDRRRVQPGPVRAQVAEFRPAFHGLGEEASVEAAGAAADVVLNGITGAVGLRPTLAALDAGTTLALANKESLIMGGPLVLERAKPGQIVPVDSEHSAIAQCLRGGSPDEVRRLVLTASGGPFRGRTREQLADVTPEQAMNHPTWDMGPVITINSGHPGQQGARGDRGAPAVRDRLRPDRGRGPPDQRRALDGGVPRRLHDRPGQPADHADPDRAGPQLAGPGARHRGPGRLVPAGDVGVLPARRRGVPGGRAWPGAAGETGGTAPAVYNAANEVCVDGVPHRAAGVLPDRRHGCPTSWGRTTYRSGEQLTVDDVLAADGWARTAARALIAPEMKTIDGRHCSTCSASVIFVVRDSGLDRACTSSVHMIPRRSSGEGHPVLHRASVPTVWSKQVGETEYGVKAIPLGGYVKIVGHAPAGCRGARRGGRARRPGQPGAQGPQVQHRHVHPADLRCPAAEWETIRPEDSDRLFYRMPWWKKVIVMAGGPTVNILIAFGIFSPSSRPMATRATSRIDTRVAQVEACVVPFEEDGRVCTDQDPVTPAVRAGLQEGDRIVAFNGTAITDWKQLQTLIRANDDGSAEITVRRDGREAWCSRRTPRSPCARPRPPTRPRSRSASSASRRSRRSPTAA